jgi:hypothetical protein
MMLIKRSCVSILSALVGLLVASGAQANSVLDPNSTLTNFSVATQQVVFDWDQSSNFPIVDTEVSLIQHGVPDGSPAGIVYEFVIPNFYDPLPKKIVQVLLSGLNPGAIGPELPSVLDIIGSDSPYGSPGPSVPVIGSYASGSVGSTVVFEAWEMFPNPDWEVVKIFVPTAFELQSISIWTQSIPEPGTVALLAAGLFGLGLAGHRRR